MFNSIKFLCHCLWNLLFLSKNCFNFLFFPQRICSRLFWKYRSPKIKKHWMTATITVWREKKKTFQNIYFLLHRIKSYRFKMNTDFWVNYTFNKWIHHHLPCYSFTDHKHLFWNLLVLNTPLTPKIFTAVLLAKK